MLGPNLGRGREHNRFAYVCRLQRFCQTKPQWQEWHCSSRRHLTLDHGGAGITGSPRRSSHRLRSAPPRLRLEAEVCRCKWDNRSCRQASGKTGVVRCQVREQSGRTRPCDSFTRKSDATLCCGVY